MPLTIVRSDPFDPPAAPAPRQPLTVVSSAPLPTAGMPEPRMVASHRTGQDEEPASPQGPGQPPPGRAPLQTRTLGAVARGQITGLERGDPERTALRMAAEAPGRVARSIAAGFEDFEGGVWGFIGGLAENVGLQSVADYYRSYAQQAAEAGARVAPSTRGLGFGEASAYSGVRSIGATAPTLAAGAVGGPAVALALMGASTAGQSYEEARRQGISPRKAAIYGAVDGIVEAATERIPATRLLDDLVKGTGLTRTLLSQLKEELPSEQIATLLQDANAWAMLPENADKPFAAYVAERPTAAAQTFIATLTATVGQSAGAVAADRVMRGRSGARRTLDIIADEAKTKAAVVEEAVLADARESRRRESASSSQKATPIESVAAPSVASDQTAEPPAPAPGVAPAQAAQLKALGYDPTAMTLVDAQEALRSGVAAVPRPAPAVAIPDAMAPESLIESKRAVEADPELRRRRDEMMASSRPAIVSPGQVRPVVAEEETPRDYSSTQVDLPTIQANRIRSLGSLIPDSDLAEDGRETEPHVTVQYGIDSDDVAPIQKAVAGIGPIDVTLGGLSLFENEDADVVKVDIEGDGLTKVRAAIREAVDAPGDTHPTYVPHATVAYVQPGKGKETIQRLKTHWRRGSKVTLDALTFSTRDGQAVTVPLTGAAIDTAALQDEADALDAVAEAERTAGVSPTATVETVDDGPTTENASGESAASTEALSRQEGMQARGESFVVYDRAGRRRPLTGPEAVDYQPKDGETYGVQGPDGFRLLEDRGGKVPPVTKRAIAPVDSATPPVQTTSDGIRPAAVRPDAESGRSSGRRIPERVQSAAEGPARRAERAERHYREIDDAVLADARAVDPGVDPDVVRRELTFRLDLFRDAQADTVDAGMDPAQVVRAVAKLGGIHERDTGKGFHGEMERLRDGAKRKGGAFGAFAGVPGVFRAPTMDDRGAPATGLPLDVMLQRLQQDGRFAWLEDVDDLIETLDAAGRGEGASFADTLPGSDILERQLGVRPGERWWEDSWQPLVETAAGEDADTDFDPDQLKAALQPKPFTAENLSEVFDLPAEQGVAVVALAEAMGLPTDQMQVVKGGEPDPDAIKQVDGDPLEQHDAATKALRAGTLSVEDYRASFERAIAQRASIRGVLEGQTKDAILKRLGPMGAARYRSEKKAAVVDAAWRDIVQDYHLAQSLSYNPMEKDGYIKAVRKAVEATTAADLTAYAERVAKSREAYLERIRAHQKALTNPETLAEFDAYAKVKGEDSLTTAQREQYDALRAAQGRAIRQAERATAPTVEAATEQVNATIFETVHTRDKYPLFVVQLGARVDREDYKRLLDGAKRLGGWYSSFRGTGAVPGFQFKTRASAEAFEKLATAGDTTAVQERVVERREEKVEASKSAAAVKLREMADSMEFAGEEDLGRDRLVNTHRRAEQAAVADANARSKVAMARTMRNLAAALDAGEATSLEGLRFRSQIEALDHVLVQAQYQWGRDEGLRFVDSEMDRIRTNVGPEVMQRVRFRKVEAPRNLNLLARLANLRGYKQLAARLGKQSGEWLRLTDEDAKDYLAGAKTLGEDVWQLREALTQHEQFRRMGITDEPSLRTAMREYVQFKDGGPKKDRVKELERRLAGQTVGFDFFPTPAPLAERMAIELDVRPGMRVLEPSAGKGNLADAVRRAEPEAVVETVEQSPTLREILDAKGYTIVGHDFDTFEPSEPYDRIIMNPPFSEGIDADHVRRAFEMLAPGGKLVAITGEGIFFRSDRKAREFRDWFDEVGGESESMKEAFTDRREVATTSVASRLLTIEKPAAAAAAVYTPSAAAPTSQARARSLFDDDATVDTLDTGEVQPRLPGDTGAVRDEERQTPREALPEPEFRLTAPPVRDRKTKQVTLFQAPNGARAVIPAGQGVKGAIEFDALGQGQALIRALTDPDVSTPIHEIAHVVRRWLLNRDVAAEQRRGISDADIATTERWAGATEGQWDTAAEEKFARGFERYVREGGPTLPSRIRDVFAKMAAWLTDVYRSITGSPIDVAITPEMRAVFDRLVTRKERLEAEAAPKGGARVNAVTAKMPASRPYLTETMSPEKMLWAYVDETWKSRHAQADLVRAVLKATDRGNDYRPGVKQRRYDGPVVHRAVRQANVLKWMDWMDAQLAAAEQAAPPKAPKARRVFEASNTALDEDDAQRKDEKPQPRAKRQQTEKSADMLASAEQAAKARLKERGTTEVLYQSDETAQPFLPDDLADLTVIGAAKVARGVTTRREFEAVMEREFGRRIRPALGQLFDQATARAKTLAEVDVDDYFNFRRINVSDGEKAELRGSIVETVLRTGRVPKERESWDTIREQAKELHPDAVKHLSAFQAAQAPFRAVREAARRRINVLNQEIVEGRKAMQVVEDPDELLAREQVLSAKEKDLQGLLDTWMRMRSEDGRNLAMHRMMVDSMETWYDGAFWFTKAKRDLGLPPGAELPIDVFRALQDILNRGRQAVETGTDPRPIQLEMAQFWATLRRSTLLETISAVRKAGLLTGPKTHARNVLGNLAFQALEETMRVPAVLIDMAVSIGTGHRTVHGVSPRAVAAASREAATKGVAQAAEVMRTGQTSAELKRVDARRELNSGFRWLDAYVNTVFRTMGATDRVFKSYAFRRSLEEQAALEAINHGVSPVELLARPSGAMLARAIADAEFATFNNPNAAAEFLSQGKAALRRHGHEGTAFVIDMAVPFANTPSNIVARMIDYTPIGLGGTVTKAAISATINGAMTPQQQRTFALAIGRGLTGSALLYLGWTLAAAGMASGIGGDDEGDRAVKEAAGVLPGAIRIGGRWHQVATFSPAGNIVTLGASMQRSATRPLREEAQRVAKVAAVGARVVLEQPMLKGLNDVLQALQRPESMGEALAGSTAGSFVPTLVNDLASAFDPYRRDARADGLKESLWAGFASRFPGARNSLPVRNDVFGDPQAQTTRAIWDPTIATVARDLTDVTLRELIKHDVGINWPRKTSNETEADYAKRVKLTGDAIRTYVSGLVQSSRYARMTAEDQTEALEQAVQKARDRVRPPKTSRARPRFQ